MKSYFILDCPEQQAIADSLYDYYTVLKAQKNVESFWNSLNRQQIQDYFSIPNLEIKNWFDTFLFSDTIEEIKSVFNQIIRGDIDAVEYFENPIIAILHLLLP